MSYLIGYYCFMFAWANFFFFWVGIDRAEELKVGWMDFVLKVFLICPMGFHVWYTYLIDTYNVLSFANIAR
jgi:hypothetical protein